MDRSPRNLEALVEHQVRRWSTGSSPAVSRGAKVAHRPVITISREYGARGAALGRLIADQLGFDFWDQKIVHAIAEDAGLADRVIETVDEHRQNAIASALASVIENPGLTRSEYAARLGKVVKTVSEHGAAVLVGRGAQYILDPKHCLRVRVVMPLEERVAGLRARKGLDDRTARAELREVDEDRAAFMQQTYGRAIANAADYDVVVNTSQLGLEGAAAVVTAAYRARFGAA
ncbi:MAG: cytidylate kinase-like family protein [Myxococcales bacterium]|nr:cytidylate kinase-like family protein [Myxococcales bacterium]MCB9732334.1 cytidylate kinase-like family protein [Deltaproteobacteria bacterium]